MEARPKRECSKKTVAEKSVPKPEPKKKEVPKREPKMKNSQPEKVEKKESASNEISGKNFDPKRIPVYRQDVVLPVGEEIENDVYEMPVENQSLKKRVRKRQPKRKADSKAGVSASRKRIKLSPAKNGKKSLADKQKVDNSMPDKNDDDSFLKDLTNVVTTPTVCKQVNFRALGQAKISTPRLESVDKKSAAKNDFDDKRKCFGFDDDSNDNDVSTSEISPVRRSSILTNQMAFSSPQLGPQRFNWSFAKQFSSSDALKSAKVQNSTKKIDEKIETSFTAIKTKPEDEEEEEVVSAVESTKSESKKTETKKSEPKLVENSVKIDIKTRQPLISGFLKKSTDQPVRKRASQGEMAEDKRADPKVKKPAKTYARKSLQQPQDDDPTESDDEDADTSEWKKHQDSHFSDIENVTLEFI